MTDCGSDFDYIGMTANLIAVYVAHNRVAASDLPTLIAATGAAFASLQTYDRPSVPGTVKATPTEIRASIQYEALISFEDGTPHKILKRHLKARGLTPETYRAKWGLPSDYPMVARGYADKRSKIARSVALGQYQRDLASGSTTF